jgi:PncC family amidohydrolase
VLDPATERLSAEVAELLILRQQTISIAESTTGGLIAASLLSVPGASAYFLGGSVVYTRASRNAYLKFDKSSLEGLKPLSKPLIAVFAEAAKNQLGATWGLAELGASGPSDSPYGHPAGSSVIGVAGPVTREIEVTTGSNHRAENMQTFTTRALTLLSECLKANN